MTIQSYKLVNFLLQTSTKPIYSFEDFGDYVYDIRWYVSHVLVDKYILIYSYRSPKHPALFATADGNGVVDLWNLNKDTEVGITIFVRIGYIILNIYI